MIRIRHKTSQRRLSCSLLPLAGIILSFLLLASRVHAQNAPVYIDGPYYVSGPTAEFYGDLVLGPNAELYVEDGTTVYFYGVNFTVDPAAKIYGADITWTNFTAGTGTAKFVFQQPNPNDNSSAQQMLNGANATGLGGDPSLMNIEIDNPHGVALTGSNTRVTGDITFTNGSLLLGDQQLELGPAATLSGYDNSKHIVSDMTGFVVKEGLAHAAGFTFPVGMAHGDYTPVTITNKGGADNDYYVRVMDYASSAPDEYAPAGMDRAWNMYATNALEARVSISHNTATNGASFSEVNAFVTQQTSAGVWMQGPPLSTVGNPVNDGVSGGVSTQSRDLTLATAPTAAASWISVSSNAQSALPITLANFTARAVNSQSLLEWSTLSESNSSHFVVQHSSSGGNWQNIGLVGAAGQSNSHLNYRYTHINPESGINYYRLQLVDKDGRSGLSSIRPVNFKAAGDMLVLPNPAGSANGNSVKVVLPASLGNTGRVVVYNSAGQVVLSRSAGGMQLIVLDVTPLPQGMYQVVVSEDGNTRYRKPLVKQ